MKCGGAPDALFSKDIGGVDTDPNRLLAGIFTEWCAIWGCDDPATRAAAARWIKAACEEARLTANVVEPLHGADMNHSAGVFQKVTSAGGNSWSLIEVAMVTAADVDQLADLNTGWIRNTTFPLQDLLDI